MTAHGGARLGSGRPKMRKKDRREVTNFTIARPVMRALRAAVPEGRRARFVEEAIMQKLANSPTCPEPASGVLASPGSPQVPSPRK